MFWFNLKILRFLVSDIVILKETAFYKGFVRNEVLKRFHGLYVAQTLHRAQLL